MRMRKRKKAWTGMRWKLKLVARTEKRVSLRMMNHRDLRKNGQDANYDRHLVVSLSEKAQQNDVSSQYVSFQGT